jgi:DNA-binding NarL/FixJ family response regulator
MKVLIVDDSSVIRGRLVGLLAEIDGVIVVGEAETPREALKLIKLLVPDIVLLDIRLREGNGIEVLQQVKLLYPGVVVIVLTNYPYPQYRVVSATMGADHFFHKSNELSQVMVTVKAMAEARR